MSLLLLLLHVVALVCYYSHILFNLLVIVVTVVITRFVVITLSVIIVITHCFIVIVVVLTHCYCYYCYYTLSLLLLLFHIVIVIIVITRCYCYYCYYTLLLLIYSSFCQWPNCGRTISTLSQYIRVGYSNMASGHHCRHLCLLIGLSNLNFQFNALYLRRNLDIELFQSLLKFIFVYRAIACCVQTLKMSAKTCHGFHSSFSELISN